MRSTKPLVSGLLTLVVGQGPGVAHTFSFVSYSYPYPITACGDVNYNNANVLWGDLLLHDIKHLRFVRAAFAVVIYV